MIIILLLILLACAPSTPYAPSTPEAGEEEIWHCPSVPETFQETDLVGTWQSWYFPNAVTDTLVLREDGTYQQIYEDDLAHYYYTSSWKRWYVEHRPSGGLYLHLEGMRYCLSTDEICRLEEGGGGYAHFHDPCEDWFIWDIGNEVILTVRGSEGLRYPGIESVPRGIILVHLRSSPDDADSFFILQE